MVASILKLVHDATESDATRVIFARIYMTAVNRPLHRLRHMAQRPPNGLTAGNVFIATSLYGSFLALFILSSLVLHSQKLLNKKQSSGPLGTSIYLTLGYMLFFVVSLVCGILYSNTLH